MDQFGVYALVFHTQNGELLYIGSTIDSFRRRLERHRSNFRKGTSHSARLQQLWDIHKSFEFRILEICQDKASVRERENFHIQNASYGALINSGPALPGVYSGRKHTQETRKKMSESAKRTHKIPPRETIARVINNLASLNKGRPPWNKGRKSTREERQKIKDGMDKKEVHDKISAANKGKTPWNKGRRSKNP